MPVMRVRGASGEHAGGMTSTAPEVADATPSDADAGPRKGRRQRERTKPTFRKRMIRTVQAVIALCLLNYVAVPQLAGLRRAVTKLSEVDGVMLVAGLAFDARSRAAIRRRTSC